MQEAAGLTGSNPRGQEKREDDRRREVAGLTGPNTRGQEKREDDRRREVAGLTGPNTRGKEKREDDRRREAAGLTGPKTRGQEGREDDRRREGAGLSHPTHRPFSGRCLSVSVSHGPICPKHKYLISITDNSMKKGDKAREESDTPQRERSRRREKCHESRSPTQTHSRRPKINDATDS